MDDDKLDKLLGERDHLSDFIAEWYPLIRNTANTIGGGKGQKLHSGVDGIEALIEPGIWGLLDAIRRYDPSRGVDFHTFAQHRVKGKMRDHIAGAGEVDTHFYKKARELKQKMDTMFSQQNEAEQTPQAPQAPELSAQQPSKPALTQQTPAEQSPPTMPQPSLSDVEKDDFPSE